MTELENQCELKSVCKGKGLLITCKRVGIESLITSAKERQDELLQEHLEQVLSSSNDPSIAVHKSCRATYISKDRKKKFKVSLKGKLKADSEAGPSKRTRSTSPCTHFTYKTHCIFCNERCLPPDPKNPSRWRKVLECTTKYRFDKEGNPYPSFQEVLLTLADQRNDEVSRRLVRNLKSAIDLPAVSGRYHEDCYQRFKNIPVYSSLPNDDSGDDSALQTVVDHFNGDSSRLWNTLELHSLYVEFGGTLIRKTMIARFRDCVGEENISVIKVEGCASIIGTKKLIGKTLKLVKLVEEDDNSVDKVVQKIRREARSKKYKSASYDLSEFTLDKTVDDTSDTLLELISKLVSHSEITMPSLCISQIIQSHITKTRSQTTLGLAVKLYHQHGSSEMIRLLNKFGLVITYDEVLRFLKSVAVHLGENPDVFNTFMGLDEMHGIICGWFDNLDLKLCTPNGKVNTHAMIHEFQQPNPLNTSSFGRARPGFCKLSIPRLNKLQASNCSSSSTLQLEHYNGTQKPLPPAYPKTVGISYQDIERRTKSLHRAYELDMKWLNQMGTSDSPMEWFGYNNLLARSDLECSKKKASTYVIGPLLDAPPNHPDTVFTSMIYMQKTLESMGMTYIHLSVDMQLFILLTSIKWIYSERFCNIIARPGIMHTVQAVCGAIGNLNQGTGLEQLISSAFGGIAGIMSGKSWVAALRAFRMVTYTLLHNFLSTGQKSQDELCTYLEGARSHPTGKHWVDNFILPTLLVHQLIRAERESDFSLQQYTLERLLKYLFAAGRFHYARHLTQHLQEFKFLPSDVKDQLQSGLFVCRHQDGFWNSVSSDQFGEQTAVRYGKGGLKGLTLSPEKVSTWINSFPISSYIARTLELCFPEKKTRKSTSDNEIRHKEEGQKRREADHIDRNNILTELGKYSHPLEDRCDSLYNIVSGQVAPPEVNVAEATDIGNRMAHDFKLSLPKNFYAPISSPIKTMAVLKKIGKTKHSSNTLDLESFFLRILAISSTREIELKDIFAYEMCEVAPSLVDEYGRLRKGQKSPLVKSLGRIQKQPKAADFVVVDAQQLIYHVKWPCGGNAGVLADSMKTRISRYDSGGAEVVLAFDKYYDLSPKDHERIRRGGVGSTKFNLDINTSLPKRDAIMRNNHNKIELCRVLSAFSMGSNVTVESRFDEKYGHDEADITMISYVLDANDKGASVIRVVSDDTDVFVLLVYWVYKRQIQSAVQMEKWDGTVLSINDTCANIGAKSLELLCLHYLTGSDATSYPFKRGKVTAIKMMMKNDLSEVSTALEKDVVSNQELLSAGLYFFSRLYGQKVTVPMAELRYKIYIAKKGKPLELKALPPTENNLLLHVKRAQLQVKLGKAACDRKPPELDITDFGWEITDGIPYPMMDKSPAGPPELLNVISCSCEAAGKACASSRCSCHSAKVPCTDFCHCCGSEECFSPYKPVDDESSIEADEDTDGEE